MASNLVTAGSGPDSLVLYISQDAYQDDAQYTVSVDGAQVGSTFTAEALRSAGDADTLTLKGNWGPGDHRVEVAFLNDAYGGTADTDRNLYVRGATYDGAVVDGAEQAVMSDAQPASFAFHDAGQAPAAGGFGATAVFADEFDATTLDRSEWPITYGGDALYWNGAFRWDDRLLSVSDGSLHIGLEKQADGMWETSGLSTTPSDYASGFSFTYGKVEIRAKADQEVDGAGPCFLLWPATNDHWPPEVDILETPHGQGMATDHWTGPNGEDVYDSTYFDVDTSQWHIYGLEWTPGNLVWTVDGQAVKTMTGHVPTEAMTVGLQGHVGAANDGWYGSPNATGVDRLDISVDYVHVYDYSPVG